MTNEMSTKEAVRKALDEVQRTSGSRPNTLVINPDVWDAIKDKPAMRGILEEYRSKRQEK